MGCPRIAGVTSSEELGTMPKYKRDYLGYMAYTKDSLSYLGNHLGVIDFQVHPADYN